MERILYLQCDSGISGDMVVGALLDLGASEQGLRRALESLDVSGYEVRVTRRRVSALDACDFDVVLDQAHDGHDHDMEYLYGHLDEPAGHDHHHDHGDGHDHGEHAHGEHQHHDAEYHSRDHAHHHHEHRALSDVTRIIDGSSLSARAKQTARRIFDIVAEAESKAHGVPVEQVHFHEVGAVDSIVDVVACAWCLDDLGITRAVVSPLAEGEGRVRAAHGVLPVPVPAVANIVAAHGLVLAQTHRQGEFVTPTGAAIAAAIKTDDALPPAYTVRACGLGSGKRAYDPPSTVRALLVEPVDAGTTRPAAAGADIWKLECEVDDCTGEALAHALERLYEAGAAEAHYLPVFMKKGRPGYQVEVLCREDLIPACEQVLFEDTTTIGVRRCPMERTCLPREEVEVSVSFGMAKAKRVTLPGGAVRAYPEYESVARLVRETGAAYQDVYREVLVAANASEADA